MTLICALFEIQPSADSRYRVDSKFRQAIADSNCHPIPGDLSIDIQCRSVAAGNDTLVLSITQECRRKSRLVDPDRQLKGLLCDLGSASRPRVDAGRAIIAHTLQSFPHIDEACRPTVVLTATDGIGAALAALNADLNILEVVIRADSFEVLRSLLWDLPRRRHARVRPSRAAQQLTIWAMGNAANAAVFNDVTTNKRLPQKPAAHYDAISVVAPLLRTRPPGRTGARNAAVKRYCAGLLRNAVSLGMEWVAPGTFLTAPPRYPDRRKIALLDALEACRDGDLVALGPGAVSRIGDTYFTNYTSREAYQRDIARGGQGIQFAFKVAKSESLRQAIMSRLASRAMVSLSDEAAKVHCTVPIRAAFDQALDTLVSTRRIIRHGPDVFGLNPGDEIHLGEVYHRLLQTGFHIPAIADIR